MKTPKCPNSYCKKKRPHIKKSSSHNSRSTYCYNRKAFRARFYAGRKKPCFFPFLRTKGGPFQNLYEPSVKNPITASRTQRCAKERARAMNK